MLSSFKLLSEVEKYFVSKQNTPFTLMVNGSPLYIDVYSNTLVKNLNLTDENSKPLYAKYVDKTLTIYYTKRTSNRRNKAVPVKDSILYEIESILEATNIFFLKTDIKIEELSVNVKFNLDLRIADINQNLFTSMRDLIYINDVKENVKYGDRELTKKEREELYDNFQLFYIAAYEKLYFKIVRVLDKTRNPEIRIFNVFPRRMFIPVSVSSSCVINPFLDPKRSKRLFSNSDIFIKCHSVNFKGVYAYYMTEVNIARNLGFNGYTRLDPRFLLKMLLGFLEPRYYPSVEAKFYESRLTGNPITKEQYLSLPENERLDYLEKNLLMSLSSSYALRLGHKTSSELYNIVRTISL